MRDILFRGKSKKNGEWVTGRGVDVNWQDAYIIIPQADGTVGWCGVDEIEVEPSTVSQYTGLTDKNGTKIFEGDIVKGLFLHSSPVNSVVAFQEGTFGLLWNRAGAETYWAFTSICNVEYEVIGNIHDNPEYIKSLQKFVDENICDACGENPKADNSQICKECQQKITEKDKYKNWW